jgi:hypothetical protein
VNTPTVTVLVDGRPLPDGCLTAPAVDPADPSVNTGLTVRWGRSTTLDQPAPATCTFTAVDADPVTRFTDRLYTGAEVIVNADASTWADTPTIGTVDSPLNVGVYNGTVSVLTGRHAVIRPALSDRTVTVTIYPRAQSSDPTAWDTVPRSYAGQSWRLTLTAAASWAGSAVTVRPVGFSGPQPGASQHWLPEVDLSTGSALFVPPAGLWWGIRVEWFPTGPSWDEWDAAQAWDAVDVAVTWDTLSELTLDNAQLTAPAAGVIRTAQLFRGRVTDLDASWDVGAGVTVVEVTAADLLADLANRSVGAEPWPAETLTARWARIGAALSVPVTSSIPAAAGAVTVTRRDVDNQPAAALYQELAKSVDGQVLPVSHIGTGVVLELDVMADRPALYRLALVGGVVVIVDAVTAAAVPVSACLVDLEPVHWSQNVADLATAVAVGWNDQTTAPQTTGRTATATETSLDRLIGAHRVAVATQLTTTGDAGALAAAILARLSRRGWTVTGLHWQLSDAPLNAPQLDAALRMLDATSRVSLPISLTDLPDWSPVPRGPVSLYLEGGTYRSVDGGWTLDLTTSSAAATGASDVRWDDLDAAWTWDQFDQSVRWDDLNGVGK